MMNNKGLKGVKGDHKQEKQWWDSKGDHEQDSNNK